MDIGKQLTVFASYGIKISPVIFQKKKSFGSHHVPDPEDFKMNGWEKECDLYTEDYK